jgi:hypothetical protein
MMNTLVGDAATDLRARLKTMDVRGLGLSPYMATYLSGVLVANVARLSVYVDLLSRALADRDPLTTTLVDFGGGHGVMSLLARQVGVANVVYVDVNAIAVEDARRLGNHLDLEADAYLAGDTDVLLAHLREQGIVPTAFCSNDVIEHVYDLDKHLRDVASLAERGLRVVMASEANGANPRIRRRTIRHQLDVELHGRPSTGVERPLDSLRAYRVIRAEIVRDADPDLSDDKVQQLAERTRGQNRVDIRSAVDHYRHTRALPDAIPHRTNTCDPETGNWAERLISPRSLVTVLNGLGLTAQVEAGRYSAFPGAKGVVARAFNVAIRAAGPVGLVLAPYYVVVAEQR